MPINYKDILYKVFWTLAAGALTALAVWLAPIEEVWALALLPLINAALAWVRQRVGATPPDAPAVGPLTTKEVM